MTREKREEKALDFIALIIEDWKAGLSARKALAYIEIALAVFGRGKE